MKRGLLLSFLSVITVFAMVTMANANSVEWEYFTYAADAGNGPGADLLMGTADDAPDANNTPGAYSITSIIWDPADPQCGPPAVGYLFGSEVRCMGEPTGGFTMTYLDVTQTETIPGSGTVKIKLDPAGTNTGNNCGLGVYQATSQTLMSLPGGGSLPMPPTPTDGKVLDADTPVSGNFVCGATATYSQAYLESVRLKLPAAATYFTVVCASINFGPLPLVPCLNNAVSVGTSILWTDDTIDCGAQCCDNDADGYTGVQCTGGDDCVDNNPMVNPGIPEICGNGVDDDCVGGDESCGGSCAGGPVAQ